MEYIKPTEEITNTLFKPGVGELWSQNFYKNIPETELYRLTERRLLFFEEVREPGYSWKTCKLMGVVLEKESEHNFDSGLLNFEPIKPEYAVYYEHETHSSLIAGENDSLTIYRKVTEVGLNGFLYGMAKYLKSEESRLGGSEAARKTMAQWYLWLKNKTELLPEEKMRISEIHGRIMRTWNNIEFWKQINNAGRRNISKL